MHSGLKPFEIINPAAFQDYLESNIIENNIVELLRKEDTTPVSEGGARIKTDTMIDDSSIGTLDNLILDRQLGNAYLLIRTFELDIREFIKDILGDAWLETIEQSLPNLAAEWKRKQKNDHNWGLRPDKDLLSYADLHDYATIIRRHKELFIKNSLTLAVIETKLKDVANYGRNPIMHSRNLTQNMLATCRSAQSLLRNWMEEIRELKQTYNSK